MNPVIKIALFIVLAFGFSQTVQSQDPATFTCLEVLPNGDVRVVWTPPVNSSGFEKYSIFYSTNGSSFNEIAELGDVTISSLLHTNANANLGNRYYYIAAVYDNGVQVSDTLKTIFLQLENFNFNEARLFWNNVHEPPPAGSSPFTKIFKEYPIGNWNLIATVSDTLRYNEPVIVCNDTLSFRVEIDHGSGCKSVSNLVGDWFKIVDEPEKPVIDSISINNNENIVLGWEPVGNAQAYIIYRFDAGIWTPIDTVYGVQNTFYEDLNSDPCSQNLTYTVATIDTCGSSGPKDENESRQSMRIQQMQFNACTEAVELQWNAYRGPDALQYRLWVSKDGGPFEELTTGSYTDTVFIHEVDEIGPVYRYYVQAIFSSGTSTSCQKEIRSFGYGTPEFLYLANTDVLPEQEIEITFHPDTSVSNSTWQVFRIDPEFNDTTLIETIKQDEQTTFPVTVIDPEADPDVGPFQYLVKALDSCQIESLQSELMPTIFLGGESISTNLNELRWTAHENWEGGVEKYYIYRKMGDGEPTFPVDSVDGQTLEYTDDLSIFSNLSIIPEYWVVAVEGDGNTFGFKELSRSNRIAISKETDMFLANAFKPGGYTPEYKPVFRFYGGQQYLFQIFNRWGNLIFETQDPDEGWDGSYQGRKVQEGVYIFKLIYESPESGSTQKTGTVTVIY